MGKIDNLEAAEAARADYENQNIFLQSGAGQRLIQKLEEIEQQSIEGALSGKTPETTNVLFERRGGYKAAKQVRNLFRDIEKDNDTAITWMKGNVVPTDAEPADTSQGEDVTTETDTTVEEDSASEN